VIHNLRLLVEALEAGDDEGVLDNLAVLRARADRRHAHVRELGELVAAIEIQR
jgi:hypothetical protein